MMPLRSRLHGGLSVVDVRRVRSRLRRSRPLFLDRVSAGFPSPADSYVEKALDLNEHLIPNPATTFFVRVDGNSMVDAGIHSGDLLVVDRSLEPRDGSVVVVALHDELTVKRLRRTADRLWLVPENPSHDPIEVDPGCELTIWGVVRHVIHDVD